MLRNRTTVLACLVALSVSLLGQSAAAQAPIVRVEEDWELELLDPVAFVSAPQIAIQMKPNKDSNEWYAMFCLNFREIPEFDEGGLELQLWKQDFVVAINGKAGYHFTYPGEVVKWTQILEISDSNLVFRIKDGESQTFGAFGGEAFSVSQPASMQTLRHYNADTSLAESSIAFGANCVKRLRLKEVRTYRINSDTPVKDTTSRVVHELPDE